MNVIVILCDTLRRDHCGPYHQGRPLNRCWSDEAPDWVVPTPNMDRLAARGTVFDQCYCGSTPCMPARRDIYTGRYEFLERGWGPLAEEDRDLPRQVSGPPNRSVQWAVAQGYKVSYLITDHFHLWEQGSGNYHMGYTGFDFVRGCEADAFYTAPEGDFPIPEGDRYSKNERHWRNVHHIRQSEGDFFCAQVFQKAAAWLEQNRSYRDFYLHLDIFDPHEPWDRLRLAQGFSIRGYDGARYDGGGALRGREARREHRSSTPSARATLPRSSSSIAGWATSSTGWTGWIFGRTHRHFLTTDTQPSMETNGRIGKLQTARVDAVGHTV